MRRIPWWFERRKLAVILCMQVLVSPNALALPVYTHTHTRTRITRMLQQFHGDDLNEVIFTRKQ
jgi:hypothetical protein